MLDLNTMGAAARRAARKLALSSDASRTRALAALADGLEREQAAILAANAQDVAEAGAAGLTGALIDRLTLTPARLRGIAADVRVVAALPDPLGQRFDERTLPNGLRVRRQRVPLGVLGVIYESRPNVTIDVAALAIRTGNAAILRGGSETLASNRALLA
ncbi:MAG: gamma-glutamyl-phosphate reductase, partial [Anaerolineales bacterium]